MNVKTLSLALAMAASACGMIGCATVAPKTEAAKENLDDRTEGVLAAMKRTDPALESAISSAYGYALIPDAGKAGVLLAGGSFGRGEVYEQGKFIGYVKLEQGTVGPQVGGQTFDELIVFETMDALRKFTRNEWAATANASAVILKSGLAASTPFKDGVKTFVNPRGGAMAEASVGGQKFTFQAATKDSIR
jgi:lipid-binding SYLF domain-containing protein